jgi:CRISPR-associated protein Cmr6
MSAYKNIGLLFNRHYFNHIDFREYPTATDEEKRIKKRVDGENTTKLISKNDSLFKAELDEYIIPVINFGVQTFKLKTIYPGLFSGSGYPHESAIEGELKLGFYFDFTSGLPCLPGSSVKGVLSQAFDHHEYIRDILEELGRGERKPEFEAEFKAEFSNLNLDSIPPNLKTIIFGDQKSNESIYKRDLFFDAFPVSAETALLGSDYITPHHPNLLKSPIPLQFMIVLPEVEFEFRFKLVASGGLSATLKKELFRQILLDQGIGAKTNVGYGQFEQEINRGNQSVVGTGNSLTHPEPKTSQTQIHLKPDEVVAEYLNPDKSSKNNVLVQITSDGVYKDQEVQIRYPAGMKDKQKLIIKLSLTKKKVIQSASVVRML